MITTTSPRQTSGAEIAVIGMAGRFPGAADLDAFWANLCAGREAASEFSDDDLLRAGLPPQALTEPRLVRRRPILDGIEDFDAPFFGYTPREAETIDPQQRVFLECAWEALESAGYDVRRLDGAVGVFGGGGPDLYYTTHILPNQPVLARIGQFAATLGNEKDFLAPRVSYKLNLRGPRISVLTGCSSSLVALHLASQSLLSGESDYALAGGVTIFLPQRAGYLHTPGGVNSPDGRCRTFDADANGTVPGDAAAVVVLRRLSDALADGDPILGVVLGSAVNNDGADKVGFTAPSVDGQADVIAEALAVADVEADSIGYLEAHGTGTRLGDAIEIAALTQAFDTPTRQFCRIGTVKPNIGHTDTAAGVTGLIKILLSLRAGQIPPNLHCPRPNPEIGFENTPFRVNTELSAWPRGPLPRRAGVSSFSVGGTNAHVVVEEPPVPAPPDAPARPAALLLVSGRTPDALDAARHRLAAHLRATDPDPALLADVAFTTQTGRAEFRHRHAVVAATAPAAADLLEASGPPSRLGTAAGSTRGSAGTAGSAGTDGPDVAFLFPGQGSQFTGMARDLYDTEPGVRATIDECAALLAPRLGLDVREVLFPADPTGTAAAALALDRTDLTQPALFTVEYALARQLVDWGITPAAMLGHSIGEFVAATLAGVFTLPAALELVAARGRLMAAADGGMMAAVALSQVALARHLDATPVGLAAVNGPEQTVVSGPAPDVLALLARLRAAGVAATALRTSHAFHSAMMDGAVDPFTELVRAVGRAAPTSAFVSCVTGTWITREQATDPAYWGRQLREPVRFAAGVATLAADDLVLVEVGPGTTLARALGPAAGANVLASLGAARDATAVPGAALMTLLGALWTQGARADWAAVQGRTVRRRRLLPTYPFQRSRHWIDPPRAAAVPNPGAPTTTPASASIGPLDATTLAGVDGLDDAGAPDGAGTAHGSAAPGATGAGDGPPSPPRPEDPDDPVQAEVLRIWRDVMGLDDIAVDDNFFDLGGHSLLAAQVVARIESAFPIQVSVAEILGPAPTVATMAAVVDSRLEERLAELTDEEAALLLGQNAELAGPTGQDAAR
ncbi:type I polyketide synthase [Candidatus Frankia nodulisporulans]|uniref:type I polyketide synthase n=1 Tax=Candidatus Frankia nodulisporulans TaxID=2060052 RepID=UPI0013D45040|nr:type I polyketide synthase [Candidatus Frankia nodulisporulans]